MKDISSDSKIAVGCEAFAELPWLIHGSSTRDFVIEPRTQLGEIRALTQALGGSGKNVVYCRQRHTNHVAAVTDAMMQ